MVKKTNGFKVKATLLALFLAAYLGIPLPANGQSEAQMAPDFQATDMDGRVVHLSQLQGCGAVIYFFASWCGACRAMTPQIVQAHSAYRNRGVIFIGINLDFDENAAREYIAQSPIPFSVVREHNRAIMNAYGVRGIPQTFVLSPNGTIVQHMVGWSPNHDLMKAARKVVAGKTCRIARSVLP